MSSSLVLLPLTISTSSPPSEVFSTIRSNVCVCVGSNTWNRRKQHGHTVFVNRCAACQVTLVTTVNPEPILDKLHKSMFNQCFTLNVYTADWEFLLKTVQTALATRAVVTRGEPIDVGMLDLETELLWAKPRPPVVSASRPVPDRWWRRAAASLELGTLEIGEEDKKHTRIVKIEGGLGCVLVFDNSLMMPFARGHDLVDHVWAIASPVPRARSCVVMN